MKVASHNWNGVTATVYYLDKGEEISRHRHDVAHNTCVLAGQTVAEVFPVASRVMNPGDDMTLPANADHEIRALKDGTIVMNMIAGVYTTTPADAPPAQAGGVELHDGTVVAHEEA